MPWIRRRRRPRHTPVRRARASAGHRGRARRRAPPRSRALASSGSRPPRRIRSRGPAIPIAPTGSPLRVKMAAASPPSPRIASSRSRAKPRVANELELAPDRGRPGERVSRQPGQAVARAGSSTTSSSQIGERRLAERGRVQRQHRADLEDLEGGVGPEDVVDDERAVAVENARREPPPASATASSSDHASDARAQLVQVEVAVAEVQQLGAELVLVAVRVLLDEAVRLQRAQEPVHRALREAEPRRELADAEPAGAAAQGLQDANRTVDDWIMESSLSKGVRHCRMQSCRSTSSSG